MADRTDAPTEGEPSGEVGTFPAPDDPENPESEPGQGAPDEPGESDDDATGADAAGDADGDAANGDADAAPPPTPDTESRMDAVTKGLERAARNYSKRIADVIAGDPMGLFPCPLCSEHFPGLLTPAPPSTEAVQATRAVIGLPDFSNYHSDTFARKCERCDGLGKTLTGSKVPEYATIRCPDCAGTGFKSAEQGFEPRQAPNGQSIQPAPTHVDDVPAPAMSVDSIEALERMAAAGRAALAGING